MKILYIHQYFKFPYESGGTRSFDLANAFLKEGITIEVISSTSNPEFKKKKGWFSLKKNGITVNYIYLPYSNELNTIQRVRAFLKFTWHTTIKILKVKGDLILATSTPLTIGIPAVIKRILHKTPFIFEVRDVWPEAAIAIGAIKCYITKKILYCLEKLIYFQSSAIVPLSSDMKESILNRFPKLNNKPVIVIENISELNRFGKYNIKNSIIKETLGFLPRFTVLYAGTFGKVNGIDYVIELAKKTKKLDDSLVYILIGNGAEKQIIKNKAKELGLLDKNVFIIDPVPKEMLAQWYFEADIGSSFVIPIKELWYNSANKFFDSLAAGRPILINYEGWQKKIIIENNIGFVFPIKITDSAAIDFVNYTKNCELLSLQRKNALVFAKNEYSLDVATKKYLSLFQKVL